MATPPPPPTHPQLYPFPTTVFILPRPIATHFATETHHLVPIPRTLVVWVDGSAAGEHLGAAYAGAIGYHDPCTGTWHEAVVVNFSTSTEPTSLVSDAEALALCEGFRAAVGMMERIDHVLLFSDSQAVLHQLVRGVKTGTEIRAWSELLRCANVPYDAGVGVEVHWVPGKAYIEGHHRVDELSRDHRRLVQKIRPREVVCCAETMGEVRIEPGDVEGMMGLLRGLMDRWGLFKGKEGGERERRADEVLRLRREKKEKREETKRVKREETMRKKEVKREKAEKRRAKAQRRAERKEVRRVLRWNRAREAEALLWKESDELEAGVSQIPLPDDIDFMHLWEPRQEDLSVPILGPLVETNVEANKLTQPNAVEDKQAPQGL